MGEALIQIKLRGVSPLAWQGSEFYPEQTFFLNTDDKVKILDWIIIHQLSLEQRQMCTPPLKDCLQTSSFPESGAWQASRYQQLPFENYWLYGSNNW